MSARRSRASPSINSLTGMYTRSDRFPACLRLLLDRGAVLDDPRVGPVLLDDADHLAAALRRDPSLIEHRTSMVSAFTPLIGASLLHVAAEFGHAKATRVLIEMGADVNAEAAVDESGLNGHTPIFHTVNSTDNRSAPLLACCSRRGQGRRSPAGRHLGQGIRVGDDVLRRHANLVRAAGPSSASPPARPGRLRQHHPCAPRLDVAYRDSTTSRIATWLRGTEGTRSCMESVSGHLVS